MDLDLKIFRMMRLGIPQERIAKRLSLHFIIHLLGSLVPLFSINNPQGF